MSGLLLEIVRSVCTCWFHNVVTLRPGHVSNNLLLLLLLLLLAAVTEQHFSSSPTQAQQSKVSAVQFRSPVL